MENYISLNIKYLREKQKISQKSLSDILGKKNPSSIAHYEKGDNFPPIDEIVKMCVFFNVDLNDFVNIDLKSKSDLKSKDFLIQVANGDGNKQSIGSSEKDLLQKMISDKDREIEYLRKMLEKKI